VGRAHGKRSESVHDHEPAHRKSLRLWDVHRHTESTTTQAKTKTAPGTKDAIAILTDDHKKVKTMFTDFTKLMKSGGKGEERGSLVVKICEELTVHAQIEEEIFYPAVRAAIGDNDLMDEADVEHAGAKELIAQLEEMEPGDDHYDAKVTVLGENVDHHVKEEQDEMFPKAKKAKLDLAALGAQMLERKQELQASGRSSSAKKKASVA
jgi:hemerythrin superfamily protein